MWYNWCSFGPKPHNYILVHVDHRIIFMYIIRVYTILHRKNNSTEKKRKLYVFRVNYECTCFLFYYFWKASHKKIAKQRVFVVQRFSFFFLFVIVVYSKLESRRISSFAKRFGEWTEDSATTTVYLVNRHRLCRFDFFDGYFYVKCRWHRCVTQCKCVH